MAQLLALLSDEELQTLTQALEALKKIQAS
jgi:hypothetical protein